ncbi:MAG: FlgO family outer membrane protein [Azovibrio sp.]|nr:FlgO family outer membrane protein [Azovibrio sp.]
MSKQWIAIPLLASLFLVAGCETTPSTAKPEEPTYDQAAMSEFIRANYAAAAELLKGYQPLAAANNFSNNGGSAPLIVSTLVNIDRLDQSSTLGRLISEQLASRISQLGQNVVELKLRNSVFMKQNQGEFLLTREIKELASAHRAQAVVVGTYADGGDYVFVSLKLVNPANSLILSSYDYALPMNRQVRRLTSNNRP